MNEMYKISEARGAEFESIISSCVWHGVPKASAQQPQSGCCAGTSRCEAS